jgi:urease accessory protein
MLVIDRRADAAAAATDELRLAFEARCKSRLRCRLASGTECDIFLPRGSVMRGGDRLLADDGRIVAVVAQDEALMEARAADPILLARAAYHLGNRHVPVAVLAGRLRFGRDHVLGEMVRQLGLQVEEILAPFEPEAGAYARDAAGHRAGHSHAHPHAHGHGHSAEGEGRGPRIHDHFND